MADFRPAGYVQAAAPGNHRTGFTQATDQATAAEFTRGGALHWGHPTATLLTESVEA